MILMVALFSKNSTVEANNLKNYNDYTDYTNIENIFKQYNNNVRSIEINKSYNLAEVIDNNLYVFISFSMGDNMLSNYLKEAQIIKQKYGINVIFVLNGFYKNSFKETQLKVDNLLKDLIEKQVAIIIDPIRFRNYAIKKVPTFLKNIRQNEYDRVIGAVSIRYVLEIFNIKTDRGIDE